MSRLRFILLLMFWLPLQNFAAAAMPFCQSTPANAHHPAALHQATPTHNHARHAHFAGQRDHAEHAQTAHHASCGECDNCHLCTAPALPFSVNAVPPGTPQPVLNHGPLSGFASYIPLPLLDPPRASL